MSEPRSSLPLDLWLMVIDYLRSEESPQHISRLSQTCKSFHSLVHHFLYQPVKFVKRENALQFAAIVETRPDLKALVTEIRHYADNGFQNFTFCSDPFYQELSTLPNLHTLVMRPKNCARRTTRLERWENMLQSTCTFIRVLDWEEEIMEDMAKILNEDTGDQEGRPPRGPFDIDEDLLEPDVPIDKADLVDRAQFCGGYLLANSLPALRTCHIGDCGVPCQASEPTVFNNSIMVLSQLKTLCVTGASFGPADYNYDDLRGAPSMPHLEELKLLNCDIDMDGIEKLLKQTTILKRLIIRGDNELNEDTDSQELSEIYGSLHLGKVFEDHCGHSLESLDLDFYDGTGFGMRLNGLRCLKNLTVTAYTILPLRSQPLFEFEEVLPPSLETLVLRHEEEEDLPLAHLFRSVKSKGLPNLHTVTVQIPDTIKAPDNLPSPEVVTEAESWVNIFKELDVTLEVVRTPYPMAPPHFIGKPKFKRCSCEVLDVFHRLKFDYQPLGFFRRVSSTDRDSEENSSRSGTNSEEGQTLG